MPIQLALELPSMALEQLNRHGADLDFAISYRVLEDATYRNHYAGRRLDRVLILDNGFHEWGFCAGWEQLNAAAQEVLANYVIIPDPSGPADARANREEMRKAVGKRWSSALALVVAGERRERAELVREALEAGIGMLCFSRMVDRRRWYSELADDVPQVRSARIHLLGMSSVEELRSWHDVPNDLSVDTSKAAKAALLGKRISTNGSLRGMGVSSKNLFAQRMTLEQIELCRVNIALLRAACGGE